jgi:hypothetical protein
MDYVITNQVILCLVLSGIAVTLVVKEKLQLDGDGRPRIPLYFL